MPTPELPAVVVVNGTRYSRAKDGCFKAERGSKPEHWTAHRAIWAQAHGPIPAGCDVTFIDGDKGHLALANLQCGPRRRKRKWAVHKLKREFVEFQGIRYFRDLDGYFKSSGSRLLHRAIWEASHGPIPEGWHVHHRDEDRSNNDLANLLAMSAHDHLSGEHGHVRGAFAEDAETRSQKRHEEWLRRQPREVECVECGKLYQTIGQRARFCKPACAKRYYYHQSKGRR